MRRLILWVGAPVLLLGSAIAQGQEGGRTGLEFRQVERLHLDDVHVSPEGGRTVDVYWRALTRYSVPVKGMRPADVELWEDDQRVPPSKVSIEALGASGRGLAAVLAIDVSGTMRGERFTRARDAALAFLERLGPEDRLAVVTFAEDVRTIVDFNASREEARRDLRSLKIDLERSQHTLLHDGAHRAVELIRRSAGLPRRAFVILFSDGRDGGSDRSREQVVQAALGREQQPHVLIFSIGYAGFGGGGLVEMRRIAEETGGEFLQAESVVHLRDFFDAIAIQMKNSYVLRFPTSLDGEQHRIRITIEKQSAERNVRYSYIADPIWPYLAALGVALLALAVIALVRRGRVVGRISIASGPSAGTVVLVRRGKTTIGAFDANQVTLASDTVSRYHAEIVASRRSIEITDLRSKNGTRVNGQVVTRSPLRPGDKILIAEFELIFER